MAEVAALGVLSCLCIILDKASASTFFGKSSWAMAGMLSALAFLGGFSIGLMLLPAPVCMVAASALADLRRSRPAEPGIITALVAGVVQAAIVIVVMIVQR